MTSRDGHVRVLPLHVANKIAAGEVVERPASVVKELVENAIDAGAKSIAITITAGGRKLVAVQDDGCGMTRDDAVLSLERQATSKILDVNDIEEIDTLGFRGEAIPSIASVSRFTLTTRRRESDEGTLVQVNAGTLAEVRSAGCPPGTLVEVRDLFCNVPARRKFLRSYATEESHVKSIFTIHALAHPDIAFSLTIDSREVYRLAAGEKTEDRLRDIFGPDFVADLLPIVPIASERETTGSKAHPVRVTGFIERPNLNQPTRRDQYIFVNGRPASAPSVQYALREAYPRRQGEVRPAAVIFIELSPKDVDVNVHPTKREVRFRDNVGVRQAIMEAVSTAVAMKSPFSAPPVIQPAQSVAPVQPLAAPPLTTSSPLDLSIPSPSHPLAPAPVEVELPISVEEGEKAKPWVWFRYLALTASGYLLIETDAGVVTINPHAARERIAYERMLKGVENAVQTLLIPETVQLSPTDASRIRSSLAVIETMGFRIEEFGRDTFKVDAVPQLMDGIDLGNLLATIARDLAEAGHRRGGERWREELIAKSVARSFAGREIKLNESGAVELVEELCACGMPYVCPRGKPIMIFTSTRELNRKFSRE